MTLTEIIAKQLGLREKQVESTINLLAQGATIPFISRYRKEATGGLNEVQVAQVKEQNDKLTELIHRRDYILQTIEEQGNSPTTSRSASANAGTLRNWRICTFPLSPSARRKLK